MGLFNNFNLDKLKDGLSKTRQKIFNSIAETITGKAVIDDLTLDNIEEILLSADIGYDATERIIDAVRKELKSEKERTGDKIFEIVQKELLNILSFDKADSHLKNNNNSPYIIIIVGVNGVGKTTTIGKLANNYKKIGKKVIVGAADTFRAAANEQLEIWAKLAEVDIIQSTKGSDPSSVVYETIKRAMGEKYDIVLIDTAGRLHNKVNLMNELDKICRVINKLIPDAPHESLLVLDGNTGQNAISQANEFSRVTDLTGLVITKLDGTAKGGVVVQLVSKQNIPVKYIGIGEGIDDLMEFDADSFIKAILSRE